MALLLLLGAFAVERDEAVVIPLRRRAKRRGDARRAAEAEALAAKDPRPEIGALPEESAN